mmetsp:Transcript_13148/g.31117  ORF Transcript_13148/g.31117 Transcript_13148/m.31117 type:complete len:93 (-) Transcript_13148:226-504(-)
MSSTWWLVGLLVVAVGPPRPGGAVVGKFNSCERVASIERVTAGGPDACEGASSDLTVGGVGSFWLAVRAFPFARELSHEQNTIVGSDSVVML